MLSGTQESEEETACLKRLKQRRPRRAHPQLPKPPPARNPARFRVQARVRVPDPAPALVPAPADGLADGPPVAPAAAASSSAARRSASSAPRCAPSARLCGRARQDRTPAAHWRLHHAPAPSDSRHQAGPEHRPAAVCYAALTFGCRSAGSYPLAVSGADLAEGYIVDADLEPSAARFGSTLCPKGQERPRR